MSSSRLCFAVSKKDYFEVERCLRDGGDPNSCMPWMFPDAWGGKQEVPLLLVAVELGNVDIVIALLEAGANTEERGEFQVAPLTRAVAEGHKIIVKKLLNHGADINIKDSNTGSLPIHYAAAYGHIKIAKMLLDRGSLLSSVNNNGLTPLHQAARWGFKAMTEWLIQQGSVVTFTDNKGRTAADIAEYHGHKEVTTLLQYQPSQSSLRLCSAVSENNLGEVTKALAEGADPNICMPWEFDKKWGGRHKFVPVLTVAAHLGYNDVVSSLLAANADTEHRGNFRLGPLAKAVSGCWIDIVRQLLNHGADINSRCSKYKSVPMHDAACRGRINMAELLYSHGSSLDSLDMFGRIPLHYAAGFGMKSMVEWFLQHGIDINSVDRQGFSAADHAASRGHIALASFLRSSDGELATAIVELNVNEPSEDEMSTTDVSKTLDGCLATNPQSQVQNKKMWILNYIDFPSHVMIKYGETSSSAILQRRKGASIDSQNLCLTFKSLGYDVNIHENRTADQTNSILDYMQENKELPFILLVILSHGLDRDTFFTSDGIQLSLKDIQQRFTDKKCPHFIGTTKVFLVNFCRGFNRENMSPPPLDRASDFYESDTAIPLVEPPHNMITIYSSHEGFESLRSPKKGTSFIQHLCKVLKEQPHLPITEVFNFIYNEMKPGKGQTPEMNISPPFENFVF